MIPKIQNIMCTVDLGCRLNLPYIARNSVNLEYNPEKFNPIVMRIRNPKCTALIFTSGKIVCAGTKTESEAKSCARKFARIIQKLGFPVKFLNYRITNIAASCELGYSVNLHKIFSPSFTEYNPEIFPALIYRRDGITILTFKSGKVILTNGKSRKHIYNAWEAFQKSINTAPPTS